MTNAFEMSEKLVEKENVSYEEAKEALEASGGDFLDALIYLERKKKAAKETAAETVPESVNAAVETETAAAAADTAEQAEAETDTMQAAEETDTAAGTVQAAEETQAADEPAAADANAGAADDFIHLIFGEKNSEHHDEAETVRAASGENREEKDMKAETKNTERKNTGADIKGFFINVKNLLLNNFLTVSRKDEEKFRIPAWLLAVLLICCFRFSVIAFIVSLFFGCRYNFVGRNHLDRANAFMDKAGDMAQDIKNQFN